MAEVPLAQLRQEADFEVEWVPFELRPEPEPTLEPHGEYIMNTWRNSVLPMAEQFGVEMHIPPVQPRTRLAHEAFEYAKRQGHAEAMADALFRISAVPTMIIGHYRIPGLLRFDDLRRVYRQIADEEAKESEGG